MNTTKNSSFGSTDGHINAVRGNIILLTLCVVILITGVIGNSIVIHIFGWRLRKSRSKNEQLLLLLAISDLMASISIPLMLAVRFILKEPPFLNYVEVTCKTSQILFSIIVTISETIIVLISIERYLVITRPLQTPLDSKIISIAIAVAGIVGILMIVPFMLSAEQYCSFATNLEKTRTGLEAVYVNHVIYFSLNFARDTLMLITVLILIHRMLKCLARTKALTFQDPNRKRERNLAMARKMLLIMIGCLFIFTVPFNVTALIFMIILTIQHRSASREQVIDYASVLIYLRILAMVSNVVNPVIYTFHHPARIAMRRKVKEILVKFFCCCKLRKQHHPRSLSHRYTAEDEAEAKV